MPQPDSPTNATVSQGFIIMQKSFNTKSSFLVGYLNHTFLNSILPLTFYADKRFESLSISIALILEGYSMILNIFSAAALAFDTSGPKD